MLEIRHLLLGSTLALGLALAGNSAFAADPGRPEVASPLGGYVSVFAGGAFSNALRGGVVTSSQPPNETVKMPLDTGYLAGVALGMRLAGPLRGEVEVSYSAHAAGGSAILTDSAGGTTASPLSGKVSSLYLLGNLWYDIDTGSALTPYLGAGAGVAVITPNFSGAAELSGGSSTAPAAQLGAGVRLQLAEHLSLDLGYRAKGIFRATLKHDPSGGNDVQGVTQIEQIVQAGLSFNF